MRRRLRYLRKLRELQVRDLGGLVFDLRRFERKRDDLVAQKIDQIRACDDELHALERALDERRDLRDVREPGIGGTCPRCFAIYGSADQLLRELRRGVRRRRAGPGGAGAARAAAAPRRRSGAAAAQPPPEASGAGPQRVTRRRPTAHDARRAAVPALRQRAARGPELVPRMRPGRAHARPPAAELAAADRR